MADSPTVPVNGRKLPLFTGKTLFSKKAHNEIVRVLNPLLNIQVVQSTRNQVNYSEQNVIIEVSAGQAASASAQVKTYRFKSMQSDYLVCRTWDGTIEGNADVYIAKPTKLRFSITGEVISGDTVAYSSYSTGAQSRHASDGTNSEDQFITPMYLTNDIIYSAQCTTGVSVGGNPLPEIDLNIDARAWAAS